MNWYKKAQFKNPWEMTREEYNSMPSLPLKPNDVFYIKIGEKDIEVIQNPTSRDIKQITQEVRKKFPWMPKEIPALRSTQDANGNKYYWKAYESVHSYIEPQLSKMVGVELNQNANRPLYDRIIYNALKEGKQIPIEILSIFTDKYPDIMENIKHNELV